MQQQPGSGNGHLPKEPPEEEGEEEFILVAGKLEGAARVLAEACSGLALMLNLNKTELLMAYVMGLELIVSEIESLAVEEPSPEDRLKLRQDVLNMTRDWLLGMPDEEGKESSGPEVKL